MMRVVGSYAINSGVMFDVWTMNIFGIPCYLIPKFGLEVAPLVIGFILGQQAVVYFAKSLEPFGTLSILFTKSPIAGSPVGPDCHFGRILDLSGDEPVAKATGD